MRQDRRGAHGPIRETPNAGRARPRKAWLLPWIEWGDRTHPPVVLLHGMLGSSGYWRQIAERMPGRHVIALDLLGVGQAPRPADAAYDYHDHCAAALATLDRLGVDDSATLLGTRWVRSSPCGWRRNDLSDSAGSC